MGILPSWDLDDRHSVVTSPEEFAWTKDFIYITPVTLDDYF